MGAEAASQPASLLHQWFPDIWYCPLDHTHDHQSGGGGATKNWNLVTIQRNLTWRKPQTPTLPFQRSSPMTRTRVPFIQCLQTSALLAIMWDFLFYWRTLSMSPGSSTVICTSLLGTLPGWLTSFLVETSLGNTVLSIRASILLTKDNYCPVDGCGESHSNLNTPRGHAREFHAYTGVLCPQVGLDGYLLWDYYFYSQESLKIHVVSVHYAKFGMSLTS